MKTILYLSNIEVPYRVRFFNELAENCHLTVLYESKGAQKRDARWAKSGERHYRTLWLPQDFLTTCRETWDAVIIGCYHTPVQILLRQIFRLRRIPCILNLDGESFLEDKGWKGCCKKALLSGAAAYLTAGERSAASLQKVAGRAPVVPYYFSSLSEEELTAHGKIQADNTGPVLVVGQYFFYKGMDVALEAARLDPRRQYLFVGMGVCTAQFLREHEIPENVKIIGFLQKEELEKLYQSSALLVLPSRRECWGLVIPEAASFGLPVVSTWGSGAAVEFLADRYPQYLARPGDAESLAACIRCFFTSRDQRGYGAFLREKTAGYSIERSVQAHITLLEDRESWCL